MNPWMKETIISCWFPTPFLASWFVKGSPSGFIQPFFSGFSSETSAVFCLDTEGDKVIESINAGGKLPLYIKLDKQEI